MPQPNDLPDKSRLTVHFAHSSYRLAERFILRATGIRHFQTWTPEETSARIGEADVAVLSGLWRADLLERSARLRFIQVSAAGYNQFDLAALAARHIRLASGAGINTNAVSEHAMALILAFTRRLPGARDNQHKRFWRPIVSDLSRREEELGGKTLLVYGLGGIGSRLARLARAFDMHVVGIKRDTTRHDGSADEVHPPVMLHRLLPRADFVVLTCPLTEETRHVIDRDALERMPESSYLVNVARGACVDESALIEALLAGGIAGAGIDTTGEEPLAADSPLWAFDNVVITPHSAGETRRYEDNVIDLLLENLDRLWRGERTLVNEVV